MTETKEKTSVHAVTIPVSYLEAIAAYNLLKEGLPDQWELEHRTEEERKEYKETCFLLSKLAEVTHTLHNQSFLAYVAQPVLFSEEDLIRIFLRTRIVSHVLCICRPPEHWDMLFPVCMAGEILAEKCETGFNGLHLPDPVRTITIGEQEPVNLTEMEVTRFRGILTTCCTLAGPEYKTIQSFRISMDGQLRETKTARFSEETFRELNPSLQAHLSQLDKIDSVYQGRKSRLIWNQKDRELLEKLGVTRE